ncbi:MAG: 2Fe-2S iron-sulfur cluster binding domain-containing protein [Pirellulaceae bacterium]|nr:2Fe-2S iron-sulfur cluster binding domain-containing protein [Pirellulaceae bacterium]
MELLSIATASAAAGLLTTSAFRLATATWHRAHSSLQNRRWRREEQLWLKRDTQHARMASELKRQSVESSSSNWRVMEVVQIADESDDCRSFYLQPPLSLASASNAPARLGSSDSQMFAPGQFVLVRPALGGASLPVRCYSLSDAPNQNWWRISVKRQGVSSSRANAVSLSNWLHDHIREGDCVLIDGPHGDFVLEPQQTAPIVLLAAGIGVTPLLSMLKHSLATNPQRRVDLFFQVQDEEHWPFGKMLHQWCKLCPALNVHTYMSRQSELPVVSHGQVLTGKFDAQTILQAVNEETQPHFYLCGPDAWMQSITSGLSQADIAPSRIHSESFGNSAEQTSAISVAEWSIRFERSAVQTDISDQAKHVWQSAKEHGLELPAACHSGACGTCKLKLLAGRVAYAHKPSCVHADDEVVACIAQPIGPIVVDA